MDNILVFGARTRLMPIFKSIGGNKMFVSYAQNFEDVMLWRALKHVENGFYIDVGANDPSIHSVTKAFYDRGWHGINIEPLPSHHADLLRERSRDINLQRAAGATGGEIEIWDCDVRGWATAAAEVIAEHKAIGHKGAYQKVRISTLADICAQYVTGEIHFLKIDVEGFEKAVIEGADFSRFRPWILVIEATKHNSTEETHTEWEGDVLVADYLLGYQDGLNRFYVAKERAELLQFFRYPPNVFDGFIRPEQLNSEGAQQAETKAQQAEAALQAVYASRSWRITAPLRFIKRSARWFVRGVWAWLTLKPGSRPRRIAKRIMRRGVTAIAARAGLKRRIVWWAQRLGWYPALRRLYQRVAGQRPSPLAEESATPRPGYFANGEDLTPWDRQMSSRLLAARSAKRRGVT